MTIIRGPRVFHLHSTTCQPSTNHALPAAGRPARKSKTAMNFQSLLTARCWQGDRHASQPSCLCLDPLWKAPCTMSWDASGEGCRKQWYSFISGPWKVAFNASPTLLPLWAPGNHSYFTCQILPTFTGQRAPIPCFMGRRTGKQFPGDTGQTTRTITWLPV